MRAYGTRVVLFFGRQPHTVRVIIIKTFVSTAGFCGLGEEDATIIYQATQLDGVRMSGASHKSCVWCVVLASFSPSIGVARLPHQRAAYFGRIVYWFLS